MRTELIVTDDGSSSIYVPELDETYHSTHGAIQESKHVFIDAGLLYLIKQKGDLNKLKIFEVGFGTGLNALLTVNSIDTTSVHVDYTSIELHPLDKHITNQLNYGTLLNEAASIFDSIHDSPWGHYETITQSFRLKKIHDSFNNYQPPEQFDLIFFDAFSPGKQQELWTLSSLTKCYQMLEPKGIFVTYSAKGQLKRDLKALNFEVETLPGPPGKAQMVRATKPG